VFITVGGKEIEETAGWEARGMVEKVGGRIFSSFCLIKFGFGCFGAFEAG
jgi:hypothetical protein